MGPQTLTLTLTTKEPLAPVPKHPTRAPSAQRQESDGSHQGTKNNAITCTGTWRDCPVLPTKNPRIFSSWKCAKTDSTKSLLCSDTTPSCLTQTSFWQRLGLTTNSAFPLPSPSPPVDACSSSKVGKRKVVSRLQLPCT